MSKPQRKPEASGPTMQGQSFRARPIQHPVRAPAPRPAWGGLRPGLPGEVPEGSEGRGSPLRKGTGPSRRPRPGLRVPAGRPGSPTRTRARGKPACGAPSPTPCDHEAAARANCPPPPVRQAASSHVSPGHPLPSRPSPAGRAWGGSSWFPRGWRKGQRRPGGRSGQVRGEDGDCRVGA